MGLWSGKRVTVTGGAGFLGSYVVQKLRSQDAEVFVPRSRDYDLTREEAAQRMYQDAQPSVLIHLAATVGGIGANQKNPGLFFHENAAMGLHVVEGARAYGKLNKLVIIGTTCSYPKFCPVPFREEDLWNGYPEETNAPYGIAKRSLLAMAWAYRQEYGLNAIYLIPANLYGPGDNFDPESSHVIPALVRKFVEAREAGTPAVHAWGTGSASREFLYAGDAADGILLAAAKYDGADHVNLATGREITIRDLSGLIAKLTGYAGSTVWDPTKPDGQPRRCLEIGRAHV